MVFDYHDKGDIFYIILTGSCSVWVPVSATQMKKVFYDYRESVANTHEFMSFNETPKELPFDIEFVSDGRDNRYSNKGSGPIKPA